jgi:hypothetical protein
VVANRDWTIDVWLVAFTAEVDREEIRRFWKANESPLLDDIMSRAPSLWLGKSEVPLPENQGVRGPVGRVVDLLSVHGTTPDWVLPVLDEDLEARLLAAYQPQLRDPSRFGCIPATDLTEYLSQHRGEKLVYRDELANPS